MHVPETSGHEAANGATPSGHGARPVLIYDGDCGFCVYWARYWRKLTGDRVEYRPYQEAAADYPDISEASFSARCNTSRPAGNAPELPRRAS